MWLPWKSWATGWELLSCILITPKHQNLQPATSPDYLRPLLRTPLVLLSKSANNVLNLNSPERISDGWTDREAIEFSNLTLTVGTAWLTQWCGLWEMEGSNVRQESTIQRLGLLVAPSKPSICWAVIGGNEFRLINSRSSSSHLTPIPTQDQNKMAVWEPVPFWMVCGL